MTECKDGHEWEWHSVNGDYYCIRCPERKSVWEAAAMLNAADKLSAENALTAYDNLAELMKTGEHPICKALRAYAKARGE